MSLQFNDLINYKGIVQIYEKECGMDRGAISDDEDKLKEFTADVNLALDDVFTIGFKASGTWQLDDSNQTDYPIIKTNLVSGQRDYTFLVDQRGNLILDIYRVVVSDSQGKFREIYPVDQQTLNNNQENTDNFINGQNLSGIPTRYDKTANGIFLDLIPNYNYANGLQVFINREPLYFSYDDLTKKAGIPGLLHRYLALKPAQDYARRNSLDNYKAISAEVQKYELITIPDMFGGRKKDEKRRMLANIENNK